MHGEFKVPSGKLVVVDLAVIDGRLANVRVSGDFFLEPDEALSAMNNALTGLTTTGC
jgi:lipoate-protein ligase A